MKRKQHPRLMKSPLTGRVYVVLKYRDIKDGMFLALEKYDVTADFKFLTQKPRKKRAPRSTPDNVVDLVGDARDSRGGGFEC